MPCWRLLLWKVPDAVAVTHVHGCAPDKCARPVKLSFVEAGGNRLFPPEWIKFARRWLNHFPTRRTS